MQPAVPIVDDQTSLLGVAASGLNLSGLNLRQASGKDG